MSNIVSVFVPAQSTTIPSTATSTTATATTTTSEGTSTPSTDIKKKLYTRTPKSTSTTSTAMIVLSATSTTLGATTMTAIVTLVGTERQNNNSYTYNYIIHIQKTYNTYGASFGHFNIRNINYCA